MNSDVLNWKCLIRVTVSQTRFDTTKSQAPLRWFVDGFGAVCLSNLFVWVFWQISLHLEVLTRFDTTKSQAPLRWFVDGFGAVCLSNLFVWVFWQISLHLEVLRQIARRQKLQFFAISRPQIQRFKGWKEVLWIEAPKIQRFKDSKVEKKFFESKPPKFKDSKIQRLKRSSLNRSPQNSKIQRFKGWKEVLWIFHLGFGASIQRTSFQPLNLWIFEFWGLRFKELFFNL